MYCFIMVCLVNSYPEFLCLVKDFFCPSECCFSYSPLLFNSTGDNNNLLKIWYTTYQSVMSMPALRSHLYITQFSENEEAKFNTMHATYALIHIYHKMDKDVLVKGCSLFAVLLNRFFEDKLQVYNITIQFSTHLIISLLALLGIQLKDQGVIPTLCNCLEAARKLIFDGKNDSIPQGLAQRLEEELLNHFISCYR